jgi:AraC-like DNA-binding protein
MKAAPADGEHILQRVRAELALGAEGYPDLSTVAARLDLSSRTLKRRLAEHGSGFQALLDQARHRDALRLLENPDLEIRQIAAVLGYRDPPSFTRAFRRWTGQAPNRARPGSAAQPR